ncbi:hypothetical protein M501DRAFT_1002303 [Patellaria atrata CBS 101060]|uniref:Transcription factor domain-containing protein n=1 Tax=Patellaria atrata CBS 101060 TaxID=1346257 RepID=A0A9P4VNQ5_9PEZI|nr:hypothetical protein M501DRAFT_1002303 [Patellaria atrata CBS 101060]
MPSTDPIGFAGNPSPAFELADTYDELTQRPPTPSIPGAYGPPVSVLPREKTQFCVRTFKEWPSMWLKGGKAPFIHFKSYVHGIPRQLQDAYAACAIYSTLSPANSSIGFSIIETKANDLLLSPNSSVQDLLASLQSLIIFQIIRLFDGDIRQRALAEDVDPILELWTNTLQQQAQHFLPGLEPTSADVPAASAAWRTWIFAESCRRTILMSYMIRSVYSIVKSGYCTHEPDISSLSFTAQSGLWAASSAWQWGQAWVEKKRLWISQMDFAALLREAGVGDIEELGLVMLVTYIGETTLNDWLTRKKREREGMVEPE